MYILTSVLKSPGPSRTAFLLSFARFLFPWYDLTPGTVKTALRTLISFLVKKR